MERELEGMKVAILVENGFEEAELQEPRAALDVAGAVTQIVSPVEGVPSGAWSAGFMSEDCLLTITMLDLRSVFMRGAFR